MNNLQNINIKSLQEQDLDLVFKWHNNPGVYQFLGQIPSLNEVKETYISYFGRDDNRVFLVLSSEFPVGYITIEGIDLNNKSCEIAIVIGEDEYRSKGIGLTAISMMLDNIFKEMSLHRVFAKINEDNLPSIKCFTKAGFQMEGRQRESRLINGEYKDILIYSILAHEWDPSKTYHDPKQ